MYLLYPSLVCAPALSILVIIVNFQLLLHVLYVKSICKLSSLMDMIVEIQVKQLLIYN